MFKYHSFLSLIVALCGTASIFAADPYPKSLSETSAAPANGNGEAKYTVKDQNGDTFTEACEVYENCLKRMFRIQQGSKKVETPLDDIKDDHFADTSGGSFTDTFEWDMGQMKDLCRDPHVNITTGKVDVYWLFEQTYYVKWKGTRYDLDSAQFSRNFKDVIDMDSSTPTPTPTPRPTPTPTP